MHSTVWTQKQEQYHNNTNDTPHPAQWVGHAGSSCLPSGQHNVHGLFLPPKWAAQPRTGNVEAARPRGGRTGAPRHRNLARTAPRHRLLQGATPRNPGLSWGVTWSRGLAQAALRQHLSYAGSAKGLRPGKGDTVFKNRNSVEIVIAKGCWVPKLSCNTFALENVITWNEILFCLYNRIMEK